MLNERHWRLLQANSDISMAIAAFRLFAKRPVRFTEPLAQQFRCYHDMAVISYCRPFTESKGLPKLSLKMIGLKSWSANVSLHKELLDYRNRVVAHTDIDRMRMGVKVVKPFGHIDKNDEHFDKLNSIKIPITHSVKGFEYFEREDELLAHFELVKTATMKKVLDSIEHLPEGTTDVINPKKGDPDYLR